MFRIKNGNDFDFVGRHNGKDYEFPIGEFRYIEDDAATHIFGIGQPDKASVLARHGWAGVTQALSHGLEILNKFSFEHMTPVYDAPMAIVKDHGPAPVGQDAAVAEEGTDGSDATVAAVAAAARGSLNNPSGRLPPA